MTPTPTTAVPSTEQQRSFRQLFDSELGFVYRALRRHGVPESDLADACQEVFMVVHRRFDSFEGRSSLRTWLYGIAVRIAAGQRRKAHMRYERLERELPDPGAAPLQLESAEQRELLFMVEEALAAMSAEWREVFALYELEGLTMREVAEALGVPENTALHRLYNARDAVRAFVARRERGAPRAAGGRR